MTDTMNRHEVVWDGDRWVLDTSSTLAQWEVELLAGKAQQDLVYNVGRYVKRAPLGMMLTRDDGFRMVK